MKSLLKKIISRKVIDSIRHGLSKFDQKIIPFFAFHPILSSFYYSFFSRQFSREHQSVLKGRIAYKQSLFNIDNTSILLRRNTHRLEKGLIMQPRRDMFASAYIEETVDCYVRCVNAGSLCDSELKWATDVLSAYFSAVVASPSIKQLQTKFEASQAKVFDRTANDITCSNKQFIPYQESERYVSSITTEQLKALFVQRRSVRWYKQNSIDIALINKAVSLAALAPSACNRQPFEFCYLTGKDAVNIAKLAMGTTGFAENIPALFVVVGDLGAYPAERDKHVIYIDASLAAMQLMLALETLGLSTCPINWPDIEFREVVMAKKLRLETHQRPIMLLSVGYADNEGLIPYSQKKSSKQLLREIKLND